MKKLLPFILLLVAQTLTYANAGDTTVIVAHSLSNLNSPPSNDDVWVSFPNSTTYRKILMRFTLGCGTPNCSGWDYTVNTTLGKKSGTLDSTIAAIDTLAHDTTWNYSDHIDFWEIGRLITPYGTYMAANSNGFTNAWTHPYYYDITDYASLLKDSVNVRVHYDGWTDAFSAKIEFICIEGQPTRTVETIREIYNGGYGYGNSAGFESAVNEKTFYIAPNVTSAKVTVNMTGHGTQGEFDPHNIHLNVNGSEVYTHILWKDDCGMNAVAPQGGTWPLNRANWCPGEKVPIFEIDITPYIMPGQNVRIDLDLDDYTIQSGQSASYGLASHLITYSEQKNYDVMMEEIIAPNSDKPYIRFNPISTHPIVKIKNTGKHTLTHTDISYWVKGGSKWYYEWTGNLPPFESATVTLPAFDWNGLDTNDRVFYAEATWPNGEFDEYEYNNKLQSNFDMTPKLDSVFFIFFKANNHPEENNYTVKNEDDTVITFKNTFTVNGITRDTLRLPAGSYAFNFNDYDSVNWGGGDGLSWWFNTQQNLETSGQLSLRRPNASIFKTFVADFGNNIHYEFTVGYNLGSNPPKPAPTAPVHTGLNEITTLQADLSIYPNPAHEIVNIKAGLNRESEGEITITDLTGRMVKQVNFDKAAYYTLKLNTGQLAKGMYFVSLTAGGTILTKRLVIQ